MALQDYYNTGDDGQVNAYGAIFQGQGWLSTSAYTISSCKLKLYRAGNPGTVTVSLYAADGSLKPTGPSLASGTYDGNSLATNTGGEWVEIVYGEGYAIVDATQYVHVVSAASGSSSNRVCWRGDGTSPEYASGSLVSSTNSGSTWSVNSAYDMMFENYESTGIKEGSGTIVGTSALSGTASIIRRGSGIIAGAGSLTATSRKVSAVIPRGTITAISVLTGTLAEISKDELETPDAGTHTVLMAYDVKRQGLNICVIKRSDGFHQAYYYDLRVGGFYPESYIDSITPYSMMYYNSNVPGNVGQLYGCKDGYIRTFDSSSTNDTDADDADIAINSYVALPVIKMGAEDKNGVVTEVVFETGGGATDNSFADTNGMTYDIYSADTYEEALEKMIDGGTAEITGSVTAPGRYRIRERLRGAYLGILLSNDTESETWAINKIYANINSAGKIR